MVFKVEDGTGLVDATSYVEVAFADSYFARIGFTAWSEMDDNTKQLHLESGTEYADLRWGYTLEGSLLKLTQSLQFPRELMYDRYNRPVIGVPNDWKKAVCEYSMQASKGPLVGSETGADVGLKKKKTIVGPITTEKEFNVDTNSITPTFKSYPKADAFIKGYLKPSGMYNRKTMRN